MTTHSPYLGHGTRSSCGLRELGLRTCWAFIQATLFRWSPRPWHGFRARLLKLFGADIAAPSHVVIFPTVKVTYPWRLHLAPRSMVGRNVTIYNLADITLEYGANVSQNCHLCAGTHDFNQWSMPLVAKPIVIGRNTWVAADVFIGPGITIGELSVIGARSVVVNDMPAHMVCAGNPCRPLKPRLDPA